jgi:hypothetical protein
MTFLDRQLRAFLLGQLSSEEHAAIEARAFEDDDFAAQLEDAQADLLDDWARGQLTPSDTARVVERFPLHQRQLAQALAKRSSPKPRRNLILPIALAASLFLVAYLWKRPSPNPVPEQIPQMATVTWTLHSGISRGATIQSFQRPSTPAKLQLSIPAPTSSANYRAVLESPGRGQLLDTSNLNAEEGRLVIPLAAIPAPGDYDLLLYSGQQLIATYAFRVQY